MYQMGTVSEHSILEGSKASMKRYYRMQNKPPPVADSVQRQYPTTPTYSVAENGSRKHSIIHRYKRGEGAPSLLIYSVDIIS